MSSWWDRGSGQCDGNDADANALPERPDVRANVLADRCGQLLQENRELLAENVDLRRKLEAAERKASKR